MKKMQVNLSLTAAQVRGFAALARNLCPVEIERIALEAGEAECIQAALDELQWALERRGESGDIGADQGQALLRGHPSGKTTGGYR